MEKGDSMPKYLKKFVQFRDEIWSVGITIADDDLVRLALLGLPKSWHSYQDSVNGKEKLPDWERLWSDLVQEEFRRNTGDGSSYNNDDEEDCTMDAKVKKGKGNKFHSKSESRKDGKKCDMYRVKFFHCHEHENYATNCPQNKKNMKASRYSASEALASQFELEFSLIACMVSSVMG